MHVHKWHNYDTARGWGLAVCLCSSHWLDSDPFSMHTFCHFPLIPAVLGITVVKCPQAFGTVGDGTGAAGMGRISKSIALPAVRTFPKWNSTQGLLLLAGTSLDPTQSVRQLLGFFKKTGNLGNGVTTGGP